MSVAIGRRRRAGQTQVTKNELHLVKIAQTRWGPHLPPEQKKFELPLVEDIYQSLQSKRLVTVLEVNRYLEGYLWPYYSPDHTSWPHLMSIVLMVNEKFREHVPAWTTFEENPTYFGDFFRSIMEACISPVEKDDNVRLSEKIQLIVFLIHGFNSLEVELVREQVQRLLSLSIWSNLQPQRLEKELASHPKLKKYWQALQKRERKGDDTTKERQSREKCFLYLLIKSFFTILDKIPEEGSISPLAVQYCERFMELVIDLECQPLTRRFFNTLLDDLHLVVRCYQSALAKRKAGHLFSQLLRRVKFYAGFEINDQTGDSLTEHEMTDRHYKQTAALQLAAFKLFPDLRKFALSNVSSVDTRDSLLKHFKPLSVDTLHEIAAHLFLVPPLSPDDHTQYDAEFLLELLIASHERRPSQLESLNNMPLYPTEEILWDESVVPYEYHDGEGCFALPKLNLQFLTLHDYLLRNLNLFRLESTYEIRADVEDAVKRMKPWVTPEGETQFEGWARMAQSIISFSVVEVGKPRIGENRPSRVRADVVIGMAVKDHVKSEWEGLRKHDVCFLISIEAKRGISQDYDQQETFVEQVGLKYVRGCEIEGMLDNEGKLIEEGPEPKPEVKGETRTFRVWLDTNQYQQDMEKVVKGGEDVYETFNILMRRKPKENNFKAVLETIRDLMNTECVVPDWIHDIFLGYGEPSAAHYTRLPQENIDMLNFNDTFISLDHLKASFPQYTVECAVDEPARQVPPFKLTFPKKEVIGEKHKLSDEDDKPVLWVEPYVVANRGPYPYNIPKRNTVPFTPTQVEAIKSGMYQGLTMVVGPPGTGKTDVAVQIISNLYHNFPEQRTLLVTHSNQALNQLFEKIMALDIDERHLLRLGHGEEELQTNKDFSRFGRVNFILALRLELLKEVERLQKSLKVPGDVSYTCETAGHFYLYQVIGRWEKYYNKVKHLAFKPEGLAAISESFPFTEYFSNAPQPLFKGRSYEEDWDIAEGCYRHVRKIFKQLEEFRAFELLRTSRDRINYLLVKEAKIIALTCTHAALKRKDLVALSFKYDNILMEESAQILEVETFIPLMLQTPLDGYNRLKRIVMIGDHHQLPPVIKNMAFQKFSNMEQSMFTRFVRLGVPLIQLDAQGRARPSLCTLYNWRYKNLGNLPHVLNSPEYQVSNPGFEYDCQLINVEDFNGVGESSPTPFFYQNLAEAEYAVAIFMYMRLLGYPAHTIAILTTYNGQKHLIRDVLNRRCARNPIFGLPEKVTTVDRYQGQQNDYIILSLVRTKHIGHLRDVRRLVVAMSRARLGLYILARVSLFSRCTELSPTFDLLTKRPLVLRLLPYECYPNARPYGAPPTAPPLIITGGMPHMAQYVYNEYKTRVSSFQHMAPPPQDTGAEQELVPGQEVSESEPAVSDMDIGDTKDDTSEAKDDTNDTECGADAKNDIEDDTSATKADTGDTNDDIGDTKDDTADTKDDTGDTEGADNAMDEGVSNNDSMEH